MKKKILLLSRHGETQESIDSITQGQSDSILTREGKNISIALGNFLSQHYNIKTILSSDLARAKETASLIASRFNNNLSITVEPSLREISSGILEGKPFEQLQKFRAADPRGVDRSAPPGGESIFQMGKRVFTWYHEFLQTAINETLIVTHKGPLTIILENCHKNKVFKVNPQELVFNILFVLEVRPNGKGKIIDLIKPEYFI